VNSDGHPGSDDADREYGTVQPCAVGDADAVGERGFPLMWGIRISRAGHVNQQGVSDRSPKNPVRGAVF
jgi:hypothetical protein